MKEIPIFLHVPERKTQVLLAEMLEQTCEYHLKLVKTPRRGEIDYVLTLTLKRTEYK